MRCRFVVLVLFLGCGQGDGQKTDSVTAEDGGTITQTTSLEICPGGGLDLDSDSGADGISNDGVEELDQDSPVCDNIFIAQEGSTIVSIQNVEILNLPPEAFSRRLPDLPQGDFCVDAGSVLICRNDLGDGSGCASFDSVAGYLYACPVVG